MQVDLNCRVGAHETPLCAGIGDSGWSGSVTVGVLVFEVFPLLYSCLTSDFPISLLLFLFSVLGGSSLEVQTLVQS